MGDRGPEFLPFLSRVGKEDKFAADFFLKAGLLSASVSLSITSLRLSRVCEFLSAEALSGPTTVLTGLKSSSTSSSSSHMIISLEGGVFFVVIEDTVTARDLDPPFATGVCTSSLFGSAVLESTCGFSACFGATGAGFFGSLWVTPVGGEDEDEEDSLMGPWPGPKNENRVFCFALGVSLGFPMIREKKNAANGRIKMFSNSEGTRRVSKKLKVLREITKSTLLRQILS